MSYLTKPVIDTGQQQSLLQGNMACPKNPFVEFREEDIEQSIAARFEQQVDRYPDRLAVKTDEHELTYYMLNRAANRVAHAILAHCGPQEEPVVLLFEPGAMMLVGMLGVLKAGKMWVPLDPLYPRVRITYIMEDSQTPLIVTNSHNLALARELIQNPDQLINVDEIDSNFSGENPDLSISPDRLACVLYTSGSTGTPKGVVHNQRNILHLIMRYTNSLHLCAEDRFSLLPSYSHMAGTNDIFRALLNGAAILPFNIKQRGLTDLGNWLMREKITVYHSVPTLFRHFVDTLTGQELFPKLRLIHLGGESLSRRDVDLFKKHFSPDCLLLNNLGCTEISSFRQYLIDKETVIPDNVVPVGYAVEDKDILLLDEDGNEVGFNCVGEIAVKSRYLAPGYWQKQEITRERIVPTPEGNGECLYRTGDVGRLLPDGCLVHLGRKDLQVQIRGYRVEIAEIEVALLEFIKIKEAAVVAREDAAGEKRLVAYVASHQGQTITTSEVHHFLQQKLPEYMLPTAFVFLDSLPQTPNGKVNRLVLPEPEQVRPELQNNFMAPRNPTEEILAGIWAELLTLDRVGIQDNFLELGGHSLLAARLISKVRDVFQIELPLRCIFESPTVVKLAEVIEQAKHNQATLRTPAITPVSRMAHRMRRSSPGLLTQPKKIDE